MDIESLQDDEYLHKTRQENMSKEKLEYTIWDVIVEDQHGKLYKLDSPWINENWKYDEQSETLWEDF